MQADQFDNENENTFMDLRQYAMLLWQWIWLIALAAVLAFVAAYIVSIRMTPVYQASTSLLVNEAPTNRTTDYSSVQTSQVMARTYAAMMTDRPVLDGVISQLKLSVTSESLKKSITVTPQRDTQLITMTVENTNPQLAADIANTLVVVFTQRIQDLQSSRYALSKDSLKQQVADMETQIRDTNTALDNASGDERDRLETKLTQMRQIYAQLVTNYEQVRLAEAQTTTSVAQVEPAVANYNSVRPKIAQNILLAVVVAILLAVGGIFAMEALDDTIKSPEEITRRFRVPVLGLIAHHEMDNGVPITLGQPRSPVSEAFRSLRTNVQYASVDEPLKVILVTSPTPSDGKTTVTANLAIVTAQSGARVTLVDADLRRPKVHRILGTNNRLGLSSLFVRPLDYLNGSLQKTRQENLYVISSGQLPPNPSELLGSRKMRDILDRIKEQSDITFIDTPPTMSVTDAVVLAPVVDGVIIVVKPGTTKMAAFEQSVDQLRRVGANLLGVIINDLDFNRSRYGYYYKNYYYSGYYYTQNTDGRRVKRKSRPASVEPKTDPLSIENENADSKSE